MKYCEQAQDSSPFVRSDIWFEYEQLYGKLCDIFQQGYINLYSRYCTTSNDDDGVFTFPVICFCYMLNDMEIPPDIHETICGRVLQTRPRLHFGYCGRGYDSINDKKHVTYGNHVRGEYKIVLDLPVFTKCDSDALVLGLTHEILHSAELEEKEVRGKVSEIAYQKYDIIFPFVEQINSRINAIYLDFCHSVKSIRENNDELFQQIYSLSSKVSNHWKFDSPDKIMCTEIKVPTRNTSYDGTTKISYDVIYM